MKIPHTLYKVLNSLDDHLNKIMPLLLVFFVVIGRLDLLSYAATFWLGANQARGDIPWYKLPIRLRKKIIKLASFADGAPLTALIFVVVMGLTYLQASRNICYWAFVIYAVGRLLGHFMLIISKDIGDRFISHIQDDDDWKDLFQD